MTPAVRTQREVKAGTQPASFYFLLTLGPLPIHTGTIWTQDGPSLLIRSCPEVPSQTGSSLVEDDH